MNRVLVVSNCATEALVAGLQLLCPGLAVRGYEIGAARAAPEVLRQDVAASDLLVLLPGAAALVAPDLAASRKIVTVPSFYFSGYHPDACYLESAATGRQLVSSYGGYHSLICFAAHRAGTSAEETVGLFRGETYEALGYFAEWDRQKAAFLQSFRGHGIELSDHFLSWLRGGPFMYSINHPKAQCLFDLAREIAPLLGETPLAFGIPPRDTLVDRPIFPCYPEIAEACGARGDYLFKVGGRNEVLTLPQFVRLCFDYYDTRADIGMRPAQGFAGKLARFEDAVLGRFGA